MTQQTITQTSPNQYSPTPNGATQNSPTPNGTKPDITFTEAPASLTIKVSYRGYDDILFTLRDSNGTALLDKLDTVLDRLDSMGATPARRGGYGAASGAGAANGNAPMCPDGHGPMQSSKKKTGQWYCPATVGTHPQSGKKLYCTHKVDV